MKVAPESLGLSKDLLAPSLLNAATGTSATLEWPDPVARWQSKHEHISMDTTGPRTDISTAPQAHLAVTSMTGRLGLFIG